MGEPIPDQNTGRPVVDQSSPRDESKPLWEETGRPVVDQSEDPRSNEKKYRSRKERVPLGLRLERELVRDIKVCCKVNRVNPQDMTSKLWRLFLSVVVVVVKKKKKKTNTTTTQKLVDQFVSQAASNFLKTRAARTSSNSIASQISVAILWSDTGSAIGGLTSLGTDSGPSGSRSRC